MEGANLMISERVKMVLDIATLDDDGDDDI
jgi:hypothetical protein